jgi:GT2 family glycosyltransferase
MDFTAVVCTYSGSDTIHDTLESLLDQSIESEYEVIVVDDGSTDNTEKIVGSFNDTRLHYIQHSTNLGLSAARNTGWKNANGTFVAYIDDDAVAPDNWLRSLRSEYRENVDGVGGYPKTYYDDVYGRYAVARGLYTYGEDAENIDGAGGMNMSFKREVLEEVGGFDEGLTHIGDDTDINIRLNKEGYNLVVNPEITVQHKFPRNFRDLMYKYFSRGQGVWYLKQKHGGPSLVKYVLFTLLSPLMVPQAVIDGAGIQKYSSDNDLIKYIIITYLTKIANYIGIVYFWYRNRGSENLKMEL